LKESASEPLPAALLRLSVGIEAVEDLWTDLDRALPARVAAGSDDPAS